MTKRISWAERHRRAGEQRTAGSILDRVLEGHGIQSYVREHRIVLDWKQIVGERIAARTWPDGLRNGALWVRVANSAWLQELSFLKETMIQRANELLGDPPLVHDVRLHIGARKQSDRDDVVAALSRRVFKSRRRRAYSPTPASGAVLAQIKQEAAKVEDDDLREVILEARIKLGL